MPNIGKQTKTIEREQIVIDLLKKEESVSGSSIDKKLGITAKNRSLIMGELTRKHKEIQNLNARGKEALYKWVEDAPVHESVDIPVMTAALTATPQTGKILPGEVWQTEESNGTKGMIFALNSLNGACQGIKLYPDSDETRTIVGENPFSVDILGRTYLGDPTHVTFKPLKYCTRRRMFTHVEKLNEAKEALMKVFGIDIPKPTVIKADPEVKIVYRDRPEKKEEKPVIPDNYIDARSAYIAHLETERDIWKEVAMKLLDKNS